MILEQERLAKEQGQKEPDCYCVGCGGSFYELNRDGFCPYCGDY